MTHFSAKENRRMQLSDKQRATILAALRFWQATPSDETEDYNEIATNSGAHDFRSTVQRLFAPLSRRKLSLQRLLSWLQTIPGNPKQRLFELFRSRRNRLLLAVRADALEQPRPKPAAWLFSCALLTASRVLPTVSASTRGPFRAGWPNGKRRAGSPARPTAVARLPARSCALRDSTADGFG
jgi:hypothetical protein